ncbi:hypothetical protein F4779DRAFT_592707 [Xylariaceae sp. FL0662B]|nr:hypothetical protein F4779DRAFT_592707 [Xylariaceae sp. FL0662B]
MTTASRGINMDSFTTAPGHPLSAKEISEQAQSFEWNENIPLKAWIRTAQTLFQEAEIYMREGNVGQSYLLYLRYTILVVECMNQHPDTKTPEGRKALKSINKTLEASVANLEKLKPIIQRDYDEWKAAEAQRQQRRNRQQADRPKSKTSPTYEEHASRDPALSSAARLLDAAEHQELAVDLAQREIKRRETDKRATRRAGVSQDEEQFRRSAGLWDDWTNQLAERQAEDEETFRKHMALTRRRLDGYEDGHVDALRDEPQTTTTLDARNSSYHYPSISKSEPIPYDPHHAPPKQEPSSQPPRPPKESFPRYEDEASRTSTPLVPERPSKEQIYPEKTLPTPDQSQELPVPPPKVHDIPSKRPQRLTFRPAAYLENGEPIRPVFLPRKLRQSFLSIASENTKRGLEMCGILCGTAVNNALFVRCLLIPEQKCSSDTCETMNETSMFDYCASEELMILGWIHTHPTQTCFMSSRDLHTQSGYQVMLPESIAIVCAPKFKPSYGIFRLTHPPGLKHILDCKQSATFHQHSVSDLYTEAEHPPGHVYESDRLDFYVHDLRPGARNSTVQNKNF